MPVLLQRLLIETLTEIIRPIIQNELKEIKAFNAKERERLNQFERHDHIALELSQEMAFASTTEERFAILQKIKNNRAGF